jgi:FkbM family methyltransferase
LDYEARVQKVYETVLKPGDGAVDVGAHSGRHLIPMARCVAPTGRILAFEPLPTCREALAVAFDQELEHLRPLVTIHGCALGDRSGQAEFVVAREAMGYSGLKERKYDVATTLERIPVEVRRLDEFALDLPSLAYIKIDAEGGELHILRGAAKTLELFRPAVTFEFGASAIGEYGITVLEMADFWIEREYRIFDILARPLVTRDAFAESATTQSVWDYVALPSEAGALAERVLPELRSPRYAR